MASSAETLATPSAPQTESGVVQGGFGPVGNPQDRTQRRESPVIGWAEIEKPLQVSLFVNTLPVLRTGLFSGAQEQRSSCAAASVHLPAAPLLPGPTCGCWRLNRFERRERKKAFSV